jgi:hypothetical protein
MELGFLDRFSKNTVIQTHENPSGRRAELFHADGREDGKTYTSKLIVAFHNFANATDLH